jgi:hypothetical protein
MLVRRRACCRGLTMRDECLMEMLRALLRLACALICGNGLQWL